jgi:type II secretory pathway component PulM
MLERSWQRLGKRQQLAALGFGSVVGIWVVYLVALRPLHRRVNQLHREVREAEQRLVESVIASHQAEAVRQAYAAYEPYLQPSKQPEEELAREVETAVRQCGMSSVSLKPVISSEGTRETVSVTVDAEATPQQLVQFFDLIQRSTRLLKVTELTVRATEHHRLRTSLVVTKLLL